MPRNSRKGYFVQGQFVAEGSALDLQLKAQAEERGPSKTARKRDSSDRQALGEALLGLTAARRQTLALPDGLVNALDEAARIRDFEGRRRQLQYVGKLMRRLDDDTLAAIRCALDAQARGSARETLALHAAERWRERLVADDSALDEWLVAHPGTDTQALRALIRQARREATPDPAAASRGLAPRRGRAWREVFQFVKVHLGTPPPLHNPDDGRIDAHESDLTESPGR